MHRFGFATLFGVHRGNSFYDQKTRINIISVTQAFQTKRNNATTRSTWYL